MSHQANENNDNWETENKCVSPMIVPVYCLERDFRLRFLEGEPKKTLVDNLSRGNKAEGLGDQGVKKTGYWKREGNIYIHVNHTH